MKRSGILFLLVLLFVGCDPIYHLNCVVTNKSGQKIWVYHMDKSKDSLAIRFIPIENGKSDTIIRETGVGYALPVFEANRKEYRTQMTFSTDSAFTDTCLFFPRSDWNYSEDGRTEGIAEWIITERDVNRK